MDHCFYIFTLSGRAMDTAVATSVMGVRPSRAGMPGEPCGWDPITKEPKSWSRQAGWLISSADHVPSTDLAKHTEFILQYLDPHKISAIQGIETVSLDLHLVGDEETEFVTLPKELIAAIHSLGIQIGIAFSSWPKGVNGCVP